MLKASFAFSIMALCVKMASHSLPSHEIVFFRSLIGSIMIFSLIWAKGVSILGRERGLLMTRGVFGFLALFLHFYTIARLPLGTAVLLNYTAPIFVALLAITFLKEKPSPLLLSAIGISFLGVYLLIEGKFESWNLPIGLGLLSAVFAAAAYVAIRAIRHRESPLTIIFYFTAISTVGSAFFLPMEYRWPNLEGWLALAGVGIGSFYAQIWMTIALRRAPASLLSPFSYLTPILTFLYGLIFFGEKLTPVSLAGAALIMLGGSLITYFETRIKPKNPSEIN